MSTKRTALPYLATTAVLFSASLALVSHPVTTHADSTNSSAAEVMNQYNSDHPDNSTPSYNSDDTNLNTSAVGSGETDTAPTASLTADQVKAQDDGIHDALMFNAQKTNYGNHQNDYDTGYGIGKIIIKAIKQARVDGSIDLAPRDNITDSHYADTFNAFNDGYSDGINGKRNAKYGAIDAKAKNVKPADAQHAIIVQNGYDAGYSLAREIQDKKSSDFIKGVQDALASKPNSVSQSLNGASLQSLPQDQRVAKTQYVYGWQLGNQFHNAEALAVTNQKLPYKYTNSDVETFYNGVKDGIEGSNNKYTLRADATYAYEIGLKRGTDWAKNKNAASRAAAIAEYYRYMAAYKADRANELARYESGQYNLGSDNGDVQKTKHYKKTTKKKSKKSTKKHSTKKSKKSKKSSKKPKFLKLNLNKSTKKKKNEVFVYAKRNIRVHNSGYLKNKGIKNVKKGQKFHVYSETITKDGYVRLRVGKDKWITANKDYVSSKYVAPKPKKKKVKKVEYHAVVRHVAVSRPVTTNYTPTYTKPATTYKPRYVKPVIHHAAKKATKHVYVGRGGRKITTYGKSYNPVVSLWNYVKRNFSMKTEYSRI